MEKAYKKFPIDKLMADLKLDAITTDGLRLELEWLREIMSSTESAVCFVHNDFRPNNILVLDANDGNDNPNDNQIIFCDFECSGYGFRGTDLGSLFAEWNREGLESYTRVQNFPNDFIVKSFIEEYIRESIRLNGDKFSEDSRNSCQHIIKETKVFTLVSNLYFITASLVMDESPDMEVFSKTNLMVCFSEHCVRLHNL
jgi:thiamine kinase-like enzyme